MCYDCYFSGNCEIKKGLNNFLKDDILTQQSYTDIIFILFKTCGNYKDDEKSHKDNICR